MKSILLKLDDSLLEEADKQAKEANLSRNGFIKKAIASYSKALKRARLERQLRKEVMMLQDNDPDKSLKDELDLASLEDLEKYMENEA